MSFNSLNIAVTGLTAQQKAMEVTAHNLANVNTEGYSRQRAELVTTEPRMGTIGRAGTGMFGTGVQVADIIRIRNQLTDSAWRAEAATGASWDVKAELMNRAEQVIGPIEGGASQAVSQFWAAWDQLSLYPDSLAARRGVLDAGSYAARWLSGAAGQLDLLQGDVVTTVQETIGEVNDLAEQVAHLNAAIFDALTASNTPNDLMDERDRVVDRLAELTGARTRYESDGTVDVFIGSHSLVDGERVERLSLDTAVPISITWDADGLPVDAGGRLGGLVDLGNDVIPGFRTELDAIAVGLRDVVNAAHAGGFDQDGNAGLAFFTGTDALTLAVDPALGTRQVAAAATAAGAPNDGNNAVVLGGLRSAPAVGGETVGNALHALAGRLGSVTATAKGNAAASTIVVNDLTRERADVSSVSVDEELTNMVRFQRAYEASARMLTAVDEMLDVLVNRTGLVGR